MYAASKPAPTADKNRQTRDNRARVVAFQADLSSRRTRKLLRMLRRELRAVLHHATPSWLSTARTGRAIHKKTHFMVSSDISKLFSPDSVNAITMSPVLWSANSVHNEISRSSSYTRDFTPCL